MSEEESLIIHEEEVVADLETLHTPFHNQPIWELSVSVYQKFRNKPQEA